MKRSRKSQKHELTTYRALSNKSTYRQKRTAVAARRWPKHCLGPSGDVSSRLGGRSCVYGDQKTSVRSYGVMAKKAFSA